LYNFFFWKYYQDDRFFLCLYLYIYFLILKNKNLLATLYLIESHKKNMWNDKYMVTWKKNAHHTVNTEMRNIFPNYSPRLNFKQLTQNFQLYIIALYPELRLAVPNKQNGLNSIMVWHLKLNPEIIRDTVSYCIHLKIQYSLS